MSIHILCFLKAGQRLWLSTLSICYFKDRVGPTPASIWGKGGKMQAFPLVSSGVDKTPALLGEKKNQMVGWQFPCPLSALLPVRCCKHFMLHQGFIAQPFSQLMSPSVKSIFQIWMNVLSSWNKWAWLSSTCWEFAGMQNLVRFLSVWARSLISVNRNVEKIQFFLLRRRGDNKILMLLELKFWFFLMVS